MIQRKNHTDKENNIRTTSTGNRDIMIGRFKSYKGIDYREIKGYKNMICAAG